MPKFTIFICVALYVQTRCFIKEYGLHNHTFHYTGTHQPATEQELWESRQVLASPPWPTSAGVPPPHRPARALLGCAAQPLQAAPELPDLSHTRQHTETMQKRIQHHTDSPLAKGTICSLASLGQEWEGSQARGRVASPEHPLLPESLLTDTGSPKQRGGTCATWQTAGPEAVGASVSHCPCRQHLQILQPLQSHRAPAKALATGPDHLLVLRQNFQAEEGGSGQLGLTGMKKWRNSEECGSFAMSSSHSLP